MWYVSAAVFMVQILSEPTMRSIIVSEVAPEEHGLFAGAYMGLMGATKAVSPFIARELFLYSFNIDGGACPFPEGEYDCEADKGKSLARTGTLFFYRTAMLMLAYAVILWIIGSGGGGIGESTSASVLPKRIDSANLGPIVFALSTSRRADVVRVAA